MTLFRSLFRREKAPEDLPMSARVSTLESDMLQMRASVESLHTVTKRVQGKLYRSIQTGDVEDVSQAPPIQEAQPTSRDKADLYAAAARLRTH